MKVIVVIFTALLYLIVSVNTAKVKSTNITLQLERKGLFHDVKEDIMSKFNLNCNGFVRIVGSIVDALANSKKEIKYYLTTRYTSKKELFEHTYDSYKYPQDFDVTKRTVFIVHGFQNDGKSKWMTDLANAFIEWGDVNAIVVDWGDYALTYDYTAAARSTESVGKGIAAFVSLICHDVSRSLPNVTYGPLHLLGHSLGAHVIGVASHEIKRLKLKWQVERLTGFDPAQPCFNDVGIDLRLDENDAPFVDIIHTNAKPLLEGGVGIADPMGDIDFYPNGGREQPGCETFDGINRTICSHSASYLLFIDSLKYSRDPTCVLQAFEWNQVWQSLPSTVDPLEICRKEKCIEMGINAEYYVKEHRGTFFSATGQNSPYCKCDAKSKSELSSFIKLAKKNETQYAKILKKSKHHVEVKSS